MKALYQHYIGIAKERASQFLDPLAEEMLGFCTKNTSVPEQLRHWAERVIQISTDIASPNRTGDESQRETLIQIRKFISEADRYGYITDNVERTAITAGFAFQSQLGNCGEKADVGMYLARALSILNTTVGKFVVDDYDRSDNHAYVIVELKSGIKFCVDLWENTVVDNLSEYGEKIRQFYDLNTETLIMRETDMDALADIFDRKLKI